MDGLDLSPKVIRILASPGRTAALGKRLLLMENERKCNFDDPSVRDIYGGMQTIAKLIVRGVRRLDPKFEGQLLGTGSYFDRLKVGDVDEFDFMLQLKALSGRDELAFLKSEPGFANIKLCGSTAGEWPTTVYCLTHDVISNTETRNLCATTCGNTINVLDASAVQDKFREVTDKVLKDMVLPEKWEHGGFNRPAFGGFRKHGPATLYQFVWVAPNHREEIKVNLDLTLSIKIPTPTDTAPFQFDLSKRFPVTNDAVQDISNRIAFNPGLSIIPLYSNFMIATGKGDKKYSWKVSCSTIEQKFLNTFGEHSLLKTLIRVLKLLRDDYLTYYKRKTRRNKRKHKLKTKKNENTRPTGSDLTHQTRRAAPVLSDLTKFGTYAEQPQTHSTSPRSSRPRPRGRSSVDVRKAQSTLTTIAVDDRSDFVACARELRWIDTRMYHIKKLVSRVQVHQSRLATVKSGVPTKIFNPLDTKSENQISAGYAETPQHVEVITARMEDSCQLTDDNCESPEQQDQSPTPARGAEGYTAKVHSHDIPHQRYTETPKQFHSMPNSADGVLESDNFTASRPVPKFVMGETGNSVDFRTRSTVQESQHQEANTDLTEVEELTALEYQRKYKSGHSKYQIYDVGQERVTPQPGSGEYYGPRQYVASIEIKFMAMSFVLNEEIFPDEFARDAKPHDLAHYVLLSLERFRHIYASGGTMRSIYFPAAVCTPLQTEKRQKVLKQIDNIIGVLDDHAQNF